MTSLVLSGLPWNENSNRGMDIITHTLSLIGLDVDVVKFPTYLPSIIAKENRKLLAGKVYNLNNSRIVSKTVISLGLPYLERYFWWIKNSCFFNVLKKMTITTFPKINFDSYDIVFLESWKGIFYSDNISKFNRRIPLVYRQSDPIELILSRNSLFVQEEHKIMRIANLVLVVNEKILSYYKKKYPQYAKKMALWENGFNVPKVKITQARSFAVNKPSAVYFGRYPIDLKLLAYLTDKLPDVTYNIIGPVIKKIHARKFSLSHPNVIFFDFLPQEQALYYIINSNVAVIPYINSRSHQYASLTSKFLMFMYYNLPIVTVNYGELKNLSRYGVNVANTYKEFAEYIHHYTMTGEKIRISYDIDFDYFSRENRVKELLSILKDHRLLSQ